MDLIWNEIVTEEDISNLNNLYGYFEDSVIVSMNYISGNSINDEFVGDFHGNNDLRIMFQRLDSNPFSIELWFAHTKQIKFLFVNPSDKCQMDIMKAKVCRNNNSIFWTMWDEFNPYNEEHQKLNDVVFVESECLKWRVIKANMIKTLIYFPPEYKNLALKIRENYIEHHHGEVDLVSETDQNDIEYARKEKYDEAIFIENIASVVIHYIKSGYTNRCSISDVCYSGS